MKQGKIKERYNRWKESCLVRRVSLKKTKPEKKYIHICNDIYIIKKRQVPCYVVRRPSKKNQVSGISFAYM